MLRAVLIKWRGMMVLSVFRNSDLFATCILVFLLSFIPAS